MLRRERGWSNPSPWGNSAVTPAHPERPGGAERLQAGSGSARPDSGCVGAGTPWLQPPVLQFFCPAAFLYQNCKPGFRSNYSGEAKVACLVLRANKLLNVNKHWAAKC